MTTSTINLNLETLAKRLEPADHQLRTDGRGVVLIAGSIGHVGTDLYLHLRIPALSPVAKSAARELIDCGCLAADAADNLFVRRLPEADIEVRCFRQMLGIFHFTDKRAR